MFRKPDTTEAEEATIKNDEASEFFCSLSPESSAPIVNNDCEESIKALSNGSFLDKIVSILKRKK